MVEQLNAIARLWWDWSVAMFWQVGLLILVIAAIDRLTRRWAWPQLRYALWSLILVKLLLPPSLSLPSGVVPELAPVVRQALVRLESEKPVAAESRVLFSLNEDLLSGPSVPMGAFTRVAGILPAIRGRDALDTETPYGVTTNGLSGGNGETPSSVLRPPSSVSIAWQVYAMAASLAGTLILGIWLVLRLRSFVGPNAQIAAAASLPQSFYNQLAGCARRLELGCIPRVVVTKRLATPAVFGVFRPVLLMPRGYLSKLSRRDTEHMLLHELAHIKRGDLVAHGLYMLLQVVYWYNPLLWLVRRQVHHLRELSCDATVAEVLREQTAAYRQTLLETARRLLTSSVEPGLGLLGLFEDSNRLLVRLNWLTKPTWRYRTMKRVTVATVAALMFACVLPMARAQQAASNDQSPEVVQHSNQASQEIAVLRARLDELMAQQQQLQEQLRALTAKRSPAEAGNPSATTPPQVQKTPDHRDATIVPWQNRTSKEQELRVLSDLQRQAALAQQEQARTMVEMKRAQVEALRAQLEAERAAVAGDKAKPQKEWAEQIQKYQADVEKWQNSDEMKQWQQQVQQWGQELGRLYQQAHGEDSAGVVPPMPPMPPMPAMPQIRGMSADMYAGPAHKERRDLPDGDRMIEVRLPERLELVQLMDLVGSRLHLNYVYDPQQVAGEVTLKIDGKLTGAMRASDLYALLETTLEERGLAMVRGDGKNVRIVPLADVPQRHGMSADMYAGPAHEERMPDEVPVPKPQPVPHVAVPRATIPHVQVPALPAVPETPKEPEHVVPCGEFVVKSFPAEGALLVENRVGSVAATGVEDDNCTVVATARIKGVDREEAERIAEKILVHVTPADGRVRVRTQLPEDISQEQRDQISIDLKIAVPSGAKVQVVQKVGNASLSSLRGKVAASVDVGSIKTRDLQGDVALRTNVGNIQFTISRDLSATVRAQAQIGSISSNLPLEITSASAMQAGNAQNALGSHATGTLGDGRNKIELITNVGSIQIRWEETPQRHEAF